MVIPMTPAPRTAKDIFVEFIAHVPPDQWDARLDQECADDHELRNRVHALLHAYADPASFLDHPAMLMSSPHKTGEDLVEQHTSDLPFSEGPGSILGLYRLVERIGEGGFGVVFLAGQERPVRRRVALKIIKPGMDTRQVIARFEAERQALALMDHPNIAKVFDAGATESGRPYFVMELVQGVPITDYCDQCQLTTRERLHLFITVCQAVQHAHQKGVIHRDIKPTNVLVAMQDGRPAPKIIDFGVAKALNQRLTEHPLATGYAQMIGTPLYMSPEQAELSPLGVDTRSDIYSLGVLLYELLTGTTPFDKDRLQAASYDELRRILREEDPPLPSARLSTLDGKLATTVADHRRTEPRRLRQTLRGELDWIVMKCLEKDRTRRYESANDLARDIERYLHHEPVQARSPSTTYRLRKFAARHFAALTTVAAVLLTIILGLTTSTILIAQQRDIARAAAERERLAAEEANRERQRAEANFRAAREAVDRLFITAAETMANQPHMEQIRRALLEDALEFYKGFLEQKGDNPTVRHETARAYLRVADISGMLGGTPQSEDAYRQAIASLEKLSADFPANRQYREDLINGHGELAYRLQVKNNLDAWISERRTVHRLVEELATDFPAVPRYRYWLAEAHTGVANGLKYVRPKEAEQHFRQAVAVCDKLRNDFPEAAHDRWVEAHGHLWLGAFLYETQRYPEAETRLRHALALREQLVAQSPGNRRLEADLALPRLYLSRTLLKIGKPNEAEQVCRHAIPIQEKLVDDFPNVPQHRRMVSDLYEEIGHALIAMRRLEEGEEALRRSIEITMKMVGDWPGEDINPAALGRRHYALGVLLHDTHRMDDAVESFRNAQQIFEETASKFAALPRNLHALSSFLADCPATQFRDPARAEQLAKQALQIAPDFAEYWFTLGVAQARAGRWQDALTSVQRCLELEKEFGSPSDASRWFFLAMAHGQLGHVEQARHWYEQAIHWMDARDQYHPTLRRYREETRQLLNIADTIPENADRQETATTEPVQAQPPTKD